MDIKQGRIHARALLFAISASLAAIGAFIPTTAAQQARVDTQERTRLLQAQRDARSQLQDATRSDVTAEQLRRAVQAASRNLETLGTATAILDPSLRNDLRRAAGELTSRTSSDPRRLTPAIRAALALLDKARQQLEADAGRALPFEGSFSRTKPKEPAVGGHASAMGPAPPSVPIPDDGAAVPVTFDAGAQLPWKMYCGSATKDHILESSCGGVALLDYDGDGLLDVYLVTGPELTPARERVPRRNALYRNLGGWTFEDVSRQAGVDLAAWGSGACVGDADGDGRLDLYVTNWGPNALFHNKGDRTFANVTAAAGVAAGGWSTGCTFFDADADGDLDLYVARYVETTWESVARAQRTLTWRGGPRIMAGPTGLPGEADLFFENVGNGRFVEATDRHGLSDRSRAYGYVVVATDYDGDGFVDLFVANDSNPNYP